MSNRFRYIWCCRRRYTYAGQLIDTDGPFALRSQYRLWRYNELIPLIISSRRTTGSGVSQYRIRRGSKPPFLNKGAICGGQTCDTMLRYMISLAGLQPNHWLISRSDCPSLREVKAVIWQFIRESTLQVGRFPSSCKVLVALLISAILLTGCSLFQPKPIAALVSSETPIPIRPSTSTPSPTMALTPTATSTPTATTALSPITAATPTAMPTIVPTATPAAAVVATKATIAPVAPDSSLPMPDVSKAKDHYWLGRPTGPGTIQWANPFYPYGSTGQGAYLLHHGADIGNPVGTPLLAPADGTVVFAGSDSRVAIGPITKFYGNAVIIELDRHWNGQSVFVLLGHMNNVTVQVGQHVARGQYVGEVGSTGIALGPHVHIEVRIGRNDYNHTRNPEFWLEPLPGHGVLAGRILNGDGLYLPNVKILLYKKPEFNSQRYYTYTYEDALGQILPDDEWGENFLLADLPVGRYRVEVSADGRTYTREVVIQKGVTTWMTLQTNLAHNNLIE